MANSRGIIAPYTEQFDLFLMMSEKMKKADDSTLKLVVLYLNGDSLTLQRVAPSNKDELIELRELDNQELTKFLVIDSSISFVAHKCAVYKLIDDLSNNNSDLTDIIDRSQQGQSLVQINASNIWLRKSALTPEQFQKLVREEDLLLENYKEPRLK